MKKYKLKFDVPGYFKGTEVIIKKNDYLIECWVDQTYGKTQVRDLLFSINENQISEWLEEIKPESIYDLGIGDSYYYLSDKVEKYTISDGSDIEEYQNDLTLGDAFLTEEDAEKELAKKKALFKIKQYCHENDIDITYDCDNRNRVFFSFGKFGVSHCASYDTGNPIGYFSITDVNNIYSLFEDELITILS